MLPCSLEVRVLIQEFYDLFDMILLLLYSGWIDVDVVMLQVRFCDTWNMVSGIKSRCVIMLLLLSSG